MAEVVVGGGILFHRGIQLNDPEASRGSLYLGLAVVYVASVAAGICLAGLQYPALPTTTLTFTQSSGDQEVEATKTVGLLSNYSSYWYVVDYCAGDKFLAFPNSRVELSDARVEEPSIIENEGAEKTCDTTPPETAIESGPSGTVDSADDRFVFSSSEPRSTFQCSLDTGPYTPCASPEDYSGLSEGEHTFSVHAVDATGNTDDTPAERAWTVCYTPERALS